MNKLLIVQQDVDSSIINDLVWAGWEVKLSADPQINNVIRNSKLLCPMCNNRSSIALRLDNLPLVGSIDDGVVELEVSAPVMISEMIQKKEGVDLLSFMSALTTIDTHAPKGLEGGAFECEEEKYDSISDFAKKTVAHPHLREMENVTCPACGSDSISDYQDIINSYHNENCNGCLWCFPDSMPLAEEVMSACGRCDEETCGDCPIRMAKHFYRMEFR